MSHCWDPKSSKKSQLRAALSRLGLVLIDDHSSHALKPSVMVFCLATAPLMIRAQFARM